VATASSDLGLQVGERVKIDASAGTPAQFKGVFAIVEVLSASNQFKYKMTSAPSQDATNPTVQKVFGAGRILVERNTVELAIGSAGAIAVHVHDNALGTQNPDHVHGDVIVRDNNIRYLDGAFDPTYAGYAVQVNGAKKPDGAEQRGGVRAGQSIAQSALRLGEVLQQQDAGGCPGRRTESGYRLQIRGIGDRSRLRTHHVPL